MIVSSTSVTRSRNAVTMMVTTAQDRKLGIMKTVCRDLANSLECSSLGISANPTFACLCPITLKAEKPQFCHGFSALTVKSVFCHNSVLTVKSLCSIKRRLYSATASAAFYGPPASLRATR